MKKTIFSLALAAVFGTSFGQDASTVSDSELGQFAQAMMMVQTINQQTQQQMVTVVQKEGLEAQRYTEIQKAQNNPDSEVQVSKEEMAQFSSATQALQQIQMQAQQEMQSTISEKTDLSVERYQEIAGLMQQDPELQGRLKAQLQKQ